MYHIGAVSATVPGRSLARPDMAHATGRIQRARFLVATRAADPYVLSKLADTEETFKDLQMKMADPDVSSNQVGSEVSVSRHDTTVPTSLPLSSSLVISRHLTLFNLPTDVSGRVPEIGQDVYRDPRPGGGLSGVPGDGASAGGRQGAD